MANNKAMEKATKKEQEVATPVAEQSQAPVAEQPQAPVATGEFEWRCLTWRLLGEISLGGKK